MNQPGTLNVLSSVASAKEDEPGTVRRGSAARLACLGIFFLIALTIHAGAKPNIIYIIADDLGYGDLGCFGQKIIRTPELDRMAAEGMKMTQHYSGSTVCAPSRCSLMTGLHQGHALIRGNREIQPEGQAPMAEDAVTIPEVLRKAGYVTGGFGKWGLGYPGSEGDPNAQGFDEFFGYNCQRQAHYYYPLHLWHNQEKVSLDGETYAHDVIMDQAFEFVKKQSRSDAPFFLFLPVIIPHAELAAPEDSMAEYRGVLEESGPYGDPSAPYQRKKYNAQAHPHAAFAAMVTRMDRDVGRLLNLLRELGIEKDTLVLFTSDNGAHVEGGADPEFFNSSGPLRGVKRDLYEGGIRVPTIAWWPGTIEAGAENDHISAFWDVMPTFCALAEISPPQGIDGMSFLPSLLGKKQAQHPYLYWEFASKGGKQAVRKGKWKAVRLNLLKNADARLELYDLENDLGETRDVAGQHPELVSEIAQIMAREHEVHPDFPLFASEREKK